jgi:hypothetical protein
MPAFVMNKIADPELWASFLWHVLAWQAAYLT